MSMEEPSPLESPEEALSISEDLIPIRLAKRAGTTTLSFDGLLSPPLQLHEDLKEGCGGQLWPAGMVLAKYLLREGLLEESIRGRTVLALALGLQQNPSPIATPPILISDLDILLPLQAHNIALNSLSSDSIISIELPWGSEVPSSLPASHRHPDTLLAADCVYFEPAFPLLQETMLLLMTEETICWFCHKKRRKADMRFILEMKKKFVVREIKTLEVFGNNGIFLYEVKKKKLPEERKSGAAEVRVRNVPSNGAESKPKITS
ncbi:MAG: hypothetical protein MMC33_005087 [Icmadophila ericetorum]|nr:hypothetical protein [Icmadophila ericetorum]